MWKNRPACAIAAALALVAPAGAQSAVPKTKAVPAPTPPPSAVPQITRSDVEQILILVRATLIAVHDADVTGNYTVLRDLGTPDFAQRNSANDLARIFTPIRDQHIDLAQAAILDPQITAANLTPQKFLHIAGWMATKPAPISFEFLYQPLAGTWRISAIGIAPARQVGATP